MVEDAGCAVAGIATVGANYKAAARDMVDTGKLRCVYCEKSQGKESGVKLLTLFLQIYSAVLPEDHSNRPSASQAL